jgi:hypothetical protein
MRGFRVPACSQRPDAPGYGIVQFCSYCAPDSKPPSRQSFLRHRLGATLMIIIGL